MLATRFSRAAVLGGRAWPHAAARVGRVPRVLAPVQPPFRNFDVYGEGRRSLSMSIQQRSQVEMLKARVAELRARDSELASSIEQLAAELEAAEAERAEIEAKMEADELKIRTSRGSDAWNEKVQRALQSPQALVVNIFARSRRGLLNDICGVLLRSDLSLQKSQWTASGGSMSIMLTVTKEDGLDQEDADAVEAALKELEVEDNDFACKVIPAVPWQSQRPTVIAEVEGLDRPGIAATIVKMLEDANIEITSLDTRVEPQPHQGVNMFRVKMGLCLDRDYIVDNDFESTDDQMEELDRLVTEIEERLDHDIHMVIKD